ncbi:hypothetical protein CCACVL1_07792 [Corchorus capsularis]|uniref:Uncharacterized protein n=1 Tax=Corchorus capsularis TaxID=210143 RepID=A0A1R3J3U6_COCAP|nr:hypothetical protein CCACVL1_07792 [Corchorus capsularis]
MDTLRLAGAVESKPKTGQGEKPEHRVDGMGRRMLVGIKKDGLRWLG